MQELVKAHNVRVDGYGLENQSEQGIQRESGCAEAAGVDGRWVSR